MEKKVGSNQGLTRKESTIGLTIKKGDDLDLKYVRYKIVMFVLKQGTKCNYYQGTCLMSGVQRNQS